MQNAVDRIYVRPPLGPVFDDGGWLHLPSDVKNVCNDDELTTVTSRTEGLECLGGALSPAPPLFVVSVHTANPPTLFAFLSVCVSTSCRQD
jgi:hypothetical protein